MRPISLFFPKLLWKKKVEKKFLTKKIKKIRFEMNDFLPIFFLFWRFKKKIVLFAPRKKIVKSL